MNEGEVRTRVDGPCGTIIIQQSSRRNAVSRSMLAQLAEAFGDLHQQTGVRGVILTGADDCFCAGTDLYELQQTQLGENAESQWFQDAQQQRELLAMIMRFPKPVIAAVNGPAFGLGLALVLACDLVLASSNASFGLPEPRRGLAAGVAIPLLAFRLGAAAANQILLRGRTLEANEAHQLGLVQELVEFDQIWVHAQQWVNEIAESSAASISMTKRILNETVGEAIFSQLAVAAAATASARTTEDAQEGVNAFLEKRSPSFLSK